MKIVYIVLLLLAGIFGLSAAMNVGMQGMGMMTDDMPMQSAHDSQKLHSADDANKSGGMRAMMQSMMGDRLPPGIDPALLPDPHAKGALLLGRYCIQCHSLPGPGMHTATEWPAVVERMDRRMEMMHGMKGGMMGEIDAPSAKELAILLRYLHDHAQRPFDPTGNAELRSPGGRSFSQFCAQCHVLPDTRQHTVAEWPATVARMRGNMITMHRKVPDAQTLQQILEFLQTNARQ